MFTVPAKNLDGDGTLHVLIQFAQEKRSRNDKQLAYLRADLFKVNMTLQLYL